MDNYRTARDSGFLAEATASGQLIQGTEIETAILSDEAPDAVHVIEHPRLDFISLPYTWSFYGLRDAALLTLDLHLAALSHGLTLSDASSYNVQFIGPKPIFIDYLSFIAYEEGQVWLGYRQFCEQFLNPLLLTAKAGVSYHAWYRGAMEGITSAELAALLPLHVRLNPLIALHVGLQARMQRSVTAARTATAKRIRISKEALANNLRSMRSWIARLTPPASQHSPWQEYEKTAHYTPEERAAKSQFVADVVAATRPAAVWDLGCNSGEYSEIALRNGANYVIGLEPDPGALNAAYQRARAKDLVLLPLKVDVTNPPPSSGWRQRERPGLAEMQTPDFVLCLALLHHLVLGRNLPLRDVLDWLVSLAPSGVIEFVPKEDPMAQQLIAWKPAVAPEYNRTAMSTMLRERARIVREETITASGRVLLAYSRQV
ncbi:MAG TPA: class I SAM-dependent methyltransferase [Longimicrobiales bacterium]